MSFAGRTRAIIDSTTAELWPCAADPGLGVEEWGKTIMREFWVLKNISVLSCVARAKDPIYGLGSVTR